MTEDRNASVRGRKVHIRGRNGGLGVRLLLSIQGRIGGVCVMITGGKAGINRGEWRGGCGYIGMAGCIYVCLIKGYVCV